MRSLNLVLLILISITTIAFGLVSCSSNFETDGSSLQIPVSPAASQALLTLGNLSTCYLSGVGSGYCWGENGQIWTGYKGILGQGSITNIGDGANEVANLVPINLGFESKSISVGTDTACALSLSGAIKCWGSANHQNISQIISGLGPFIGDESADMGANLPYGAFSSQFSQLNSISIGRTFACGLNQLGAVICWGNNTEGQLGHETLSINMASTYLATSLPEQIQKVTVGDLHACSLSITGVVRCWGRNSFVLGSGITYFSGALGAGESVQRRGGISNEMGANLRAVNLGSGQVAIDVAAKVDFSCALLLGGKIKCWGNNEDGRLGQGDKAYRGYDAATTGDNLLPIDLGTGLIAEQIAVGSYFACALFTDKHIKCWGNNEHGQLGLGDTLNRGDDANEMGDALPFVNLGTNFVPEFITAGGAHVCAISKAKEIKCWGFNSSGQLGLGDTNDRGDQPGEMGDSLSAVTLPSL